MNPNLKGYLSSLKLGILVDSLALWALSPHIFIYFLSYPHFFLSTVTRIICNFRWIWNKLINIRVSLVLFIISPSSLLIALYPPSSLFVPFSLYVTCSYFWSYSYMITIYLTSWFLCLPRSDILISSFGVKNHKWEKMWAFVFVDLSYLTQYNIF